MDTSKNVYDILTIIANITIYIFRNVEDRFSVPNDDTNGNIKSEVLKMKKEKNRKRNIIQKS